MSEDNTAASINHGSDSVEDDLAEAGEEWVDVITFAGTSLVVAAILLGNHFGLSIPISGAGAAGAVGLGITLALIGAALKTLSAGLLSWFRVIAASAAVCAVGGTVALATLPSTPVTSIPAWLIAGIGVFIFVTGLEISQRTAHPASDPAERVGGGGRDPHTERLKDATWSRHLTGLLRGRFDWTAAHTRRAVHAAQGHLVRTGRSAEQEYGPPLAYAAYLMSQQPSHRKRFNRHVRAQLLLALLFISGGIWGLLAGDGGWSAYGSLALGLSQLGSAGWEWTTGIKDAPDHSPDDVSTR